MGTTAAILKTLANLPQDYKIIRDKNTDGVSSYTYTLLFIGTGLWAVYGGFKNDWPVIIANGITSLTCLVILILHFTSPKIIKIVHETVSPAQIQKEVKRNT